jgi:hypothetical protein
MSLTIIDLYGEDATKEKIFETIQMHHPQRAIMAGHGNATTYTSQREEVVLTKCENDEVMSGTLSHFISCSVGQQLLPSIIQKGGVGTIGYIVDFTFMINTDYSVEKDPYAEPFKDVTVTIITKLLQGATLQQVWQAGVDKCNEWIAKLWGRPETDWAEVISCLEHDRDGLVAFGDKTARVLGGTVMFVRPDWGDVAMQYASYWSGAAIGAIVSPRPAAVSLPQLLGLAALFVLITGRKPIV